LFASIRSGAYRSQPQDNGEWSDIDPLAADFLDVLTLYSQAEPTWPSVTIHS
jgi:hypothetical protein